MSMMEELEIGGGDQTQLRADLESKAMIDTGYKDAHGRAVIWFRVRYIDPRSSSSDIARLWVTVWLHALRDTSVQRHGIALLTDQSRSGMLHLTPATINILLRKVLPNLPMRLGVAFVINPPWIMSQVIMPIVFTALSLEFKKRHIFIHGARKELWAAQMARFDLPITSIPTELGGTACIDLDALIARVCLFANVAPACPRRVSSEDGPATQ
mmetsp:Transcript_21392/g.34253  ORF Transcript_21392/g.34253 Transcript_21392/m.34253 type:complete len:212 (-) Transcript_21392:198-833(-)